MLVRKLKLALVVAGLLGVMLSVFCCNSGSKETAAAPGPSSPWLNVYDTSAHYVGIDVCKGCHSEIYNTFIQTGMGKSFGVANHAKSAADFSPSHALVYDKDLDLYYRPFWQGDTLYFMEYRLDGKDTVHKRLQKIDYIVGSGQHTNSHIYNSQGYFYQAPITFFTQQGKWDLAPGFEKGASTRFSRMIEAECMTCHNGYPDFVANSDNKYNTVKLGIDCERCHGPGSLHVQAKQSGVIVDTSKGPDYTIVNPRRLSTELQNNICQRCHLQGIAVLNDGRSFFDFHPGMKLSEVMNVYMPQYEGAKDKMIMASHVERMKKSACYINSGKMSCITCHNPHVSVKFTPQSQYIAACNSCHNPPHQGCTETPARRAAVQDNCITCHMPHNGSIDIPHVAVTDHFIRKRPGQDTVNSKIQAFLGLRCFNNDKAGDLAAARAYLEFYERYTPNKGLIDSALYYLGRKQAEEKNKHHNADLIRCYFLLNDAAKVTELAGGYQPSDYGDPWTAYRVAEAHSAQQQPDRALPWYARAVELRKYSLDFQSKYGACFLALNRLAEARSVYEFILQQSPLYAVAEVNLGYIDMQEGNSTMAYDHYSRARNLDPDNEQLLINLAVWYHGNGQDPQAARALKTLLKRHPANDRAKAMLSSLGNL